MQGFSGTSRFEVIRPLGHGGMGAVYEAFDRERQLPVALKALSMGQPEALLRFKREFRALQSVHHPNLVSIGELFEHEGTWFFTMELIHGVDLLAHVRVEPTSSDGRTTLPGLPGGGGGAVPSAVASGFDLARLRASFHQLALGLAALHRHGHIHRDVKPGNVMVTPANRVVLLDFGLIREGDEISPDSSPDLICGTPEYMAPEQAMGPELTPAADWYALGALLYEALTGATPFVGAPMAVMVKKQTVDPPPPGHLVRDVPDDLDALCMALLRRDPRARPTEQEILRRLYVELRRDDRTYLTLPLQPGRESFAGRERELERLRGAVDQTAPGRRNIVFVTGEWGIGKSALLREFARQTAADARAPLVWSGRCHERETIPFKSVDMLIDDASRFLGRCAPEAVAELLPTDAALLARTFPVLERAAEQGGPPPAPIDELPVSERRARLFAAFSQLMQAVARERLLVLIVDDLQWADPDGLGMLGELLRESSELPILFVGAIRTEGGGLLLPSPLVDGIERTEIATVDLAGLSAADGETLVQLLCGEVEPTRSRRLVKQSAGHPLLLREACLTIDGERFDLAGALQQRITALGPEPRALLDVLALASSALPQDVAGEAAALDWPSMSGAISSLRAGQLVKTIGLRRTDLVEIAHARVRAATLASLLAPATRALHERIAVAMERWPRASVAALAQHWIGAGRPGDALRCLRAGAAQAADALAFAQAIALYGQAATLCDDDERVLLLRRIAELTELSRR